MIVLADAYRCPACKGPLAELDSCLACAACGLRFPVHDGVPDFVPPEDMPPEGPNNIWLLPEIVEARDTVYRLCARDLRGMAYCMREIGTRTLAGCRVLEVGMGTGHFTAWLAEVVAPGTGIFAFDCSWPMLEVARANARGLSGVHFFRANARGPLPFPDGWFDLVFARLAPLGPKGMPHVQAAHALLRPGGWYFEASWRRERFDTPPTQWATDHGFESAEHHCWRYPRLQSEEERLAARIEGSRVPGSAGAAASREEPLLPAMARQDVVGGILVMTDEELLVARKPSAYGSSIVRDSGDCAALTPTLSQRERR